MPKYNKVSWPFTMDRDATVPVVMFSVDVPNDSYKVVLAYPFEEKELPIVLWLPLDGAYAEDHEFPWHWPEGCIFVQAMTVSVLYQRFLEGEQHLKRFIDAIVPKQRKRVVRGREVE